MYVGKLQTALMYHLSMIYCHSSYRMNVRNVGGIFYWTAKQNASTPVNHNSYTAIQNQGT